MVEGAGKESGVNGLDVGDAEGGLDGEGGDGGGAKEPMSGKRLQISRNSGPTGGIVARNGEERSNGRAGR